jgi:L-ornithine N5-oxygenase
VLAVGFGPSNIALAIAVQELNVAEEFRFIDAREGSEWQPGMMLAGSDIQNNPLRDLVTPRNPKSHFTFINYLKEAGRLFEYLNLGINYPLRTDYAQYVSWVAHHFSDQVDYGVRALRLELDEQGDCWRVITTEQTYLARVVILGTGRSPHIPEVFRPLIGSRVFHLDEYLPRIEALRWTDRLRKVVVVGASQSAVEINLDLANRFPDLEIHMVHRSFSMRSKDTSPFSDRVYMPEFVDYFFNADQAQRDRLYKQLYATNYSAADADVLRALYLKIYEERLHGRTRIHLHDNTAVEGASLCPQGIRLSLREQVTGRAEELLADAVVVATGFLNFGRGEGRELAPPLLRAALSQIPEHVELPIQRHYRLLIDGFPPVFLNGLCESSHGFGDAGSFSLLSLRAAEIATAVGTLLQEPEKSIDEDAVSPQLVGPE